MKQLRPLKLKTVVSSIVVFLVAAQLFGWLSLTGSIQDSLKPISRPLTSWGQSLGFAINGFLHAGGLNHENQQLEAQNQSLLAQLGNLKMLEEENLQLREQLNFGAKNKSQYIGADVIGLSPDTSRRLLLINRGSTDGIKQDMVVVSAGHLVGKIYKANGHSAVVLLVNDEQFRVLSVDANTHAPGIVKGQVGGSVLMERIPADQSVKDQDIILTSGADGEFPAGLVVGTVNGITHDIQGIFQIAQINQSFESANLRVVMVRK